MSDFDTGDYLRHVPTSTHHTVACVHDDVVYTAGSPSRTLRIADCEIVQKASTAERLASLQAMAAVQSNQHRPKCARDRLQEMAQAYDGGGC